MHDVLLMSGLYAFKKQMTSFFDQRQSYNNVSNGEKLEDDIRAPINR